MTKQEIAELVRKLESCMGQIDMRKVLVEAINITKDEDADICRNLLTGHRSNTADAARQTCIAYILSTKIKET